MRKSLEKPVNFLIYFIIRRACRIEAGELKKLPLKGPYIIVINHINFLEVPLLYLVFQPRRVRAFVKIETWDHPFYKHLAKLWDAIPVRRGQTDSSAMRQGLDTIKGGKILVLAPEGTRSGNGILQKGFAGVVPLAVRGRVPIYPVAHFGGERLYKNLKALRRTKITVKVGKPFMLDLSGRKVNQLVRQEAVDQVMSRLAELLPKRMRGFYADTPLNEGLIKDL